MDTGRFVILLLLGILAIQVVIWTVIITLLRRMARQARDRWVADGVFMRRGPESAHYRGHTQDRIPVRGNGLIGLTPHELRVVRFLPHREFVIPLAQMTRIEIRRTWQGSYRARMPVIGVYYQDGGGEQGIGVSVRDVRDWAGEIARAANVPVHDAR